jgi:hypothetical protein
LNYDCSKDNNTRAISNTNESCEVVNCDDKQRKCVIDENDCFALIALAVGLSAGAIGGIAAAAFIAALMVSGGTAAAAYGQKPDGAQVTSGNPMFQAAGLQGENPL